MKGILPENDSPAWPRPSTCACAVWSRRAHGGTKDGADEYGDHRDDDEAHKDTVCRGRQARDTPQPAPGRAGFSRRWPRSTTARRARRAREQRHRRARLGCGRGATASIVPPPFFGRPRTSQATTRSCRPVRARPRWRCVRRRSPVGRHHRRRRHHAGARRRWPGMAEAVARARAAVTPPAAALFDRATRRFAQGPAGVVRSGRGHRAIRVPGRRRGRAMRAPGLRPAWPARRPRFSPQKRCDHGRDHFVGEHQSSEPARRSGHGRGVQPTVELPAHPIGNGADRQRTFVAPQPRDALTVFALDIDRQS